LRAVYRVEAAVTAAAAIAGAHIGGVESTSGVERVCIYPVRNSSQKGKDTLFAYLGVYLTGIYEGVRETVREKNFESSQ
jgi:hypothetical protein